MSILSPTYNADLHFSDIVEIHDHKWNCAFFEIDQLSPEQLKTGMVDGTFEDCWPKLLAEYYSETHTRTENIGNILYCAITKYLKQDPGQRPRHIYMPSISQSGKYDGRPVWLFNIWDEIQREYVFEMKFMFKND